MEDYGVPFSLLSATSVLHQCYISATSDNQVF